MAAVLGILQNQSSFVLSHAEKNSPGDDVSSCSIHFTRGGIGGMLKNSNFSA